MPMIPTDNNFVATSGKVDSHAHTHSQIYNIHESIHMTSVTTNDVNVHEPNGSLHPNLIIEATNSQICNPASKQGIANTLGDIHPREL